MLLCLIYVELKKQSFPQNYRFNVKNVFLARPIKINFSSYLYHFFKEEYFCENKVFSNLNLNKKASITFEAITLQILISK